MTTKAKKAPLSLLTTLFILALTATPALAARPHEFSKTFAEPGTAAGQLTEPAGVAVNEATGDVYILDTGNDRIDELEANGTFVRAWGGAVDGLPGFGECTTVSTCQKGVSGSNPGEFSFPAGEGEAETSGIAVDNSCALQKPALAGAACTSFDPSYGDVYVVDGGHSVVDKFSPAGEYLGQIVPPTSNPLQGVAVDPTGAVWLYRQEGGAVIDGYTNAVPNEFVGPEIAPNSFGGQAQPGFAVDSQGDFYGRLAVKGIPRIVKWGHSGNLLIESLDGNGSTAVAAEQTTNASFVDSGRTIGAFSPEGALLERLGEEGGAKHLTRGMGVGVSASSESLYVADAATGTVVVFGPARATAPKVAGESFSKVGSDRASVAAEIEPRSEAGEAATEYHFEYGRCATLDPGSCKESGYEANTANGLIPPDFAVHTVASQLEGLQPHTTYHFRAVATNSHLGAEPGAEVTFTTEAAGGELTLPDNRGWELVSPPDKQGALIEPISEVGVVQAAAGGGGITYLANAPTEAQPAGYANTVQVLSRRATTSWSSRDIAIAHQSPTGGAFNEGPEYKFFDPELSLSAVQPFGPFNPALSEEASEATAYLHSLDPACGSSCYHPLVSGKPPFANVPPGTEFGEGDLCEPTAERVARNACGPRFLGASEDLKHVVLEANAALTPGAAPLGGLYEWSSGALAPVSVLPGGESVGEGQLGGPHSEATRGAISSDGSRIAWEARGDLYQRDMARGETVQLDAAQAPAGEGATEKEEREAHSGGGQFQMASADGSRVIFTDTQPLTSDSGAEPEGTNPKADLYECRIEIEAGKLTCALRDLTPEHGGESASVQGSALGAGEDATSVYFVAKGVLSEAANARGEKAEASQPNLYVHDGGGTRFITTLAGGDEHDWSPEPQGQPTRASNNGRFLELMSQASLTGYDNRDVATNKAVAEVYLYDAETNDLSCASCEPSGARPVGVEYRKLEPGNGGLVGGPVNTWQRTGLVAANVPGWTDITGGGTAQSRHQPRYLNNEGRLFFNSADALAPQDSNGTQDVYEYEPPGVGGEKGCSTSAPTYSARSGGCVSLISSGASSQESAFMDASESGDDVFFLTSAKLSPLDVDAARDVYDAHVCTTAEPCISFTSTEVPPCTTEASCKPSPTPQPSIFGAPASSTFQGLGNPGAAVAVKPKAKPLTRAQKLAAALKVCRAKKNRHKRQACEASAKKKYAPLKRAKKRKG